MAFAMQEFDFAIVGGGMVGSTLALALSRLVGPSTLKPRILLLESRRPESIQHPGFDARAIALSYGSQLALQELDLWPLFSPGSAAIDSIHVSDRGHIGRVELHASEYQLPQLGHVVELFGVGQRLLQRIEETPAICYQAPAQVASLTQHPERIVLQLASGEQATCRLLLLADGGSSAWHESLGLVWRQESYGQSAIIANLRTQGAQSGRAWERFTEAGPLALLPLGDNRLSLVWSMTDTDASSAMRWSDEQFLARLQQTFCYRAGRFVQVGERASYPLQLRQTQQTRHHRLLLLGNAAQQLHPVAGQGFNLGLRDVMTLYHLLQPLWQEAVDPGRADLLQTYSEQRQADVARTVWMTSSLVRLFSSSAWPLVGGRNIGLAWMNRCGQLKRLLARQALGLAE